MNDIQSRLGEALADRYRIERELGAGGMATVYLAADLKHHRQVAIKVLKPELAAVLGAERFLIEIQTTANLQHPHILPLFDSGQVGGTVFYVMPFVEGESLRERLVRERHLPVADAVRIASEVAAALDYAHRHGVIHRDIKPENILLHDGRALVADFGIALAASRTEGGSRLTETGMSLGTPHYMSPEQALGERTLDARTDVYALGCVLHEALTGEPPFSGPTAQAVIARLLTSEPDPVTTLRRSVPNHVAAAILIALAKLPADRFPTAAAFAAALAGGPATVTEASRGIGRAGGPGRGARVVRLLWPTAFGLATVAGGWGWLRPVPERVPSQLSIPTPVVTRGGGILQPTLDISPDGRTLLYVQVIHGERRLVRRRLEDAEGTPLPKVPAGFAGARISPNGREFVATNMLTSQMFRFPIEGGEGRPLPQKVAFSAIMAWGEDDALWLSPLGAHEVVRLAPDGEVTKPIPTALQGLSVYQVLPGGRYALAIRSPVGTSFGPAYVLDLRSGETKPLFNEDVVELRYSAGFLVYVLPSGTLEAVRFDLRNRRTVGTSVQLSDGVSLTSTGNANFATSNNGTVVFVPQEDRTLLLLDRAGNARPAVDQVGAFHIPRFSPDGRQLLTDITTAEGRDVWRVDLASRVLTRVTQDRDGHDATWEPDGRHIAYISARRNPSGALTLYRAAIERGADADSLISSPAIGYTGVWLPDRSAIVTSGNSLLNDSKSDIAIIRNGGRGPVDPLVASRFEESFPAVSPDGRWLAYVSDETGTQEVYVRPLERDGDVLRVSVGGGAEPVWGSGGRELFYRALADNTYKLVTVELAFASRVRITARHFLFAVDEMATSTPHANYDVSPDGRTFAVVQQNPSTRIVVIQNLAALITQLERERGR